MELDAAVNHHKYIFVDEASFNLAKTRRRGRNLIGQRATIQVPGQRGGNVSMCAAISEDGVVGCRPVLGSYNTEHLIAFLNELEQACQGEDVIYVIVWDNVSFHHAELIREWFQAHPWFMTLYPIDLSVSPAPLSYCCCLGQTNGVAHRLTMTAAVWKPCPTMFLHNFGHRRPPNGN